MHQRKHKSKPWFWHSLTLLTPTLQFVRAYFNSRSPTRSALIQEADDCFWEASAWWLWNVLAFSWMLHGIFHIWVQVAAVGKKVSPLTDGCGCKGGDLSLATQHKHLKYLVTNVTPSRHAAANTLALTHQMTSPHYRHRCATTVVAECSSRVSRHLLCFPRKRKQHRESEQGSIQHTPARINADPPFMVHFNHFNKFPLVIYLKINHDFGAEGLCLPSCIHGCLVFFHLIFFFFGVVGEWMRWHVPHPRSSEFLWSASEGINPSSPPFLLLSLHPPLRHPSEHCSTGQAWKIPHCSSKRGGEGEVQVGWERERMRMLRKSSMIVLRSSGRREWEELVFTCKWNAIFLL